MSTSYLQSECFSVQDISGWAIVTELFPAASSVHDSARSHCPSEDRKVPSKYLLHNHDMPGRDKALKYRDKSKQGLEGSYKKETTKDSEATSFLLALSNTL